MISRIIIFFSLLFFLGACSGQPLGSIKDTSLKVVDTTSFDKIIANNKKPGVKTIHVFVALCDNKYQGIVPVPAKIGNGQDPVNNLYWGAAYGVKTFFSKSNEWKVIEIKKNPAEYILEQILFKHKSEDIYLLADAYDGQFIKQTTIDFLQACSGSGIVSIKANSMEIPFGGASDIIAYIGHDGLMDFSLSENYEKQDDNPRKAIILACISKKFFSPYIKKTGAEPLLWSTGLMAPEAYILHAALNKWAASGNEKEIRMAAASAYSQYQQCNQKAAQNLLVTGW